MFVDIYGNKKRGWKITYKIYCISSALHRALKFMLFMRIVLWLDLSCLICGKVLCGKMYLNTGKRCWERERRRKKNLRIIIIMKSELVTIQFRKRFVESHVIHWWAKLKAVSAFFFEYKLYIIVWFAIFHVLLNRYWRVFGRSLWTWRNLHWSCRRISLWMSARMDWWPVSSW